MKKIYSPERVAKLHDSEKSMILPPIAEERHSLSIRTDGGLPSRVGEEVRPQSEAKGRFCTSKSFAIRSQHLKLAHELWRSHLQKTDLAIDATCGNGHDTLFLSTLCSTIGLDIQPQALATTRALTNAPLYLLSHEHIDTLPLPKPPRLIVYNLGYLPRSDKSITTLTQTTLISVEKSLALLAPGGALSITCYPGHPEGAREQQALELWLNAHPHAIHHKWGPKAPSLIWLLKP